MRTETEIDKRLGGLLGMARRAGRLTAGFDAVAALVSENKADIVLIAADLSEKTEKELRFAAQGKKGEIFRVPLTKQEMGRLLGFPRAVGVLALQDKGFAASVRKLCRRDSKEEV